MKEYFVIMKNKITDLKLHLNRYFLLQDNFKIKKNWFVVVEDTYKLIYPDLHGKYFFFISNLILINHK